MNTNSGHGPRLDPTVANLAASCKHSVCDAVTLADLRPGAADWGIMPLYWCAHPRHRRPDAKGPTICRLIARPAGEAPHSPCRRYRRWGGHEAIPQ